MLDPAVNAIQPIAGPKVAIVAADKTLLGIGRTMSLAKASTDNTKIADPLVAPSSSVSIV
jgi:hypothetical protein